MSGGSMDYLFSKLEDCASDLCDKETEEMARDFSNVLHDAEWWHSGDISEEQYRKTVRNFKKKWFGESREERIKKYIEEEFEQAKRNCLNLIGK